jgi:hypothetical protein
MYASLLLALPASSSVVLAQSPTQISAAPYSTSQPAEPSDATLPDAPSAVQQANQQTTTPPPANETDAQRKAREQREESEREVRTQKKQRAGGVMPLFNVVISGQTVPLSPKQKFDLSFHTIIDPYTIGLAVVLGGGFGELDDSHPGYHHGPSGLAKRIGASYADNVDGNLIGNALLPTILHQDPRYYRKGSGSIKSRIVYSALTTFICYGDNGKKQFNTSNVLGNFISGAISNAYYPSDERGAELTIQNGFTVTLEGMVGAQLLEFSPDFNNYLRRRHQRKLDAQAAASGHTTPATPPPPPPPPPQP